MPEKRAAPINALARFFNARIGHLRTAHSSSVSNTFWRSLQTLCLTRILITSLLLLYTGFGVDQDARELGSVLGASASFGYLGGAFCFLLLSLYLRAHFTLQLWLQLAIDMVVIAKLYIVAGGAASGLAILFLFPLAGAAILSPLPFALLLASIATLTIIGGSGYQALLLGEGLPEAFPRVGLYGIVFFAAVYTINQLAARLIQEEERAARRGRALWIQEAINRLVVEDMHDGILVVGKHFEVLSANPAVERMFGIKFSRAFRTRLDDIPMLMPVAQVFREWQEAERVGPSTGMGGQRSDDSLVFMVRLVTGTLNTRNVETVEDYSSHFQLRFAKVDVPEVRGERTVIFVRDVSEIENQAQQLKLAAMGRLTASIAHEVRNPLAAIAHAASLLSEDELLPVQRRLVGIVNENGQRLDRMIEDILKLSRKAHMPDQAFMLGPTLEEMLAEFQASHALAEGVIALSDMQAQRVRFDVLHLREIIFNLLGNALRYASGKPGSIRISATRPTPDVLELHIRDDGPPISPQVRSHLFEPFYTTSHQGTGLGLYVARELCLNNGALLNYEYRSEAGDAPAGRFVITFVLGAKN